MGQVFGIFEVAQLSICRGLIEIFFHFLLLNEVCYVEGHVGYNLD